MRMEDLVAAIENRRVRITDHADESAADDDLTLDEIYHSVQTGQIIEDYADDRPYPSCLIYGTTASGAPVHTVWAYNAGTAWAVLITVYRPSPEKWIDCVNGGSDVKPFEACPVCGGDLEARQVDKLVKGGGNVAALRVPAEVCLHCGERLYSEETVRLFEEVRTKLEHHDTDTFEPIGTTFRVA